MKEEEEEEEAISDPSHKDGRGDSEQRRTLPDRSMYLGDRKGETERKGKLQGGEGGLPAFLPHRTVRSDWSLPAHHIYLLLPRSIKFLLHSACRSLKQN